MIEIHVLTVEVVGTKLIISGIYFSESMKGNCNFKCALKVTAISPSRLL